MIDPISGYICFKICGFLAGKGVAAGAVAHGQTVATMAIAPHLALGGTAANAQLATSLGISHSMAGPLAVTHLAPRAGGLLGVVYSPVSWPTVPQRLGLTYSMVHGTGRSIDGSIFDMVKEFGPKVIEANTNLDERIRRLANDLLIGLERPFIQNSFMLPRSLG